MDVLMGMHNLYKIKRIKDVLITYSYSRKIMWLKMASTNNNPKVILLYYLSTVLSCQGI